MTNGDMVEEMARAIREEQVRQYRDDDRAKCPDAAYYEEHVGPYALAQAAATIAKGRIAELEAALRDMIRLADMGLEESLHEPEENGNFVAYNRARAALKDSPIPVTDAS